MDNHLREGDKKAFYVFLLAISVAMAVNVAYPYLWGPDEPREAESAREALETGNFVIPHLCGLPFLEKPPLYYDMIAAAYKLTGRITPPVARAVSAGLGALMLASVFFFGLKWGGMRRGVLAALILASMPQFYRYSHWILLDIGVGAFSVMALSAFFYWLSWADDEKKKNLALFIFYLGSLCAFLTKGIVGVFHTAVVTAAFLFATRRTSTMKQLLSSPFIFVFLAPMAVWIYLYYREGGICYLHEHFVNNIIGRFIHRHFELAGCHFYWTDLGNQAPWYFYIQRLPDMFGLALVVLPFALWSDVQRLRKGELAKNNHEPVIFLIIWMILPIALLSFPVIKEVSYVLPSYGAAAILIAGWLDERLEGVNRLRWEGVSWLFMIILLAASRPIFFGWLHVNVKTYLVISAVFFLAVIPFMIKAVSKKHFTRLTFLTISMAIGALVIANTPKVILHTRPHLKNKCYMCLANMIKPFLEDKTIYLYKPGDTLRGAIPFYMNKTTYEIDRPWELCSALLSNNGVVIMDKDSINDLTIEPPCLLIALLGNYRIVILPKMGLDAQYALLIQDGGAGVWTISK
ncbi:MAG: ArnT family glycosyltransferase [Dissulfurimicrobium sp.]|uniref:ArnT family glycosyltransferase n=1 Tax=Dissulfurimicrobium sp. TaxID=2022436 RepID=UPI003D0A3A9A